MEWISFAPTAEFEDRAGIVRAVFGCSIAGRFEFFDRLKQIETLLKTVDSGESWQALYERDKKFRHYVDRCLVLNGIDPDWVTLGMVEVFLFHRLDEETQEYKPGWLVELNLPKQSQSQAKGSPLSLTDIIAALSLQAGISDAIAAVSTLPAHLAGEILEERERLSDVGKNGKPKRSKRTVGRPSREDVLRAINAS
jgi:hypothetical protein